MFFFSNFPHIYIITYILQIWPSSSSKILFWIWNLHQTPLLCITFVRLENVLHIHSTIKYLIWPFGCEMHIIHLLSCQQLTEFTDSMRIALSDVFIKISMVCVENKWCVAKYVSCTWECSFFIWKKYYKFLLFKIFLKNCKVLYFIQFLL